MLSLGVCVHFTSLWVDNGVGSPTDSIIGTSDILLHVLTEGEEFSKRIGNVDNGLTVPTANEVEFDFWNAFHFCPFLVFVYI
jgi:hypothetical protein